MSHANLHRESQRTPHFGLRIFRPSIGAVISRSGGLENIAGKLRSLPHEGDRNTAKKGQSNAKSGELTKV